MAHQTSMALSMVNVIVGVRVPTRSRRRLLGRRDVGNRDLDWWYRGWNVGYRGRDLLGEDREEEEETLSSTGKTRRGWERHDLAGEFCVCDTIRVHDLRICHATITSRTKKKKDTARTIVLDCER